MRFRVPPHRTEIFSAVMHSTAMEQVNELEQEYVEKEKLLERLKYMEETIAEKEKLTERIQEFESERTEKEKRVKRVKELEVEIELRIQATINEEKISALESQFIELNKSQEKNEILRVEPSNDDDSNDASSSNIMN